MNLSTFLIALVLAVVLILIAVHLYKNHKKGVTNCGSQCAGCALKDTCHQSKKKQEDS